MGRMGTLGIAALVSLVGATVVVDGEGACPTPAAVARNLEQLGLASPQNSAGGPGVARRARLSAVAGRVRVQLHGADGRLLADRTLPAGGSCEELARAAALIVVAWDRALASGVSLGLDENAVAPERASASAAVSARSAGAAGARRVRYDVGAGFLASLAGADFAPGAMVEAYVTPSRLPLGARIGVQGTATRSVQLGAGEVAWTRVAVALGPHLRLGGRRWVLDTHAEALLGAAYAGGTGYTVDRSGMSFDPGLGGGLRLGYRARSAEGGVLAYVGASVAGWPREHRLRVLGTTETGRLGRAELLLTGGVAFGRF